MRCFTTAAFLNFKLHFFHSIFFRNVGVLLVLGGIFFLQLNALGQVKSGPYIQQGGRYEGKSTVNADQQVGSCAISGDGNTAIIASTSKGAYILIKSQNRWIQQSEILAAEDIKLTNIAGAAAI